MSKITCPYCFGTFGDDHVVFRANAGWTLDELDEMRASGLDEYGRSISDDEIRLRELFRRYDSQDSSGNDKKLDDLLLRFWDGRGGESAFASADPQWNMPHIVPGSPEYKLMVARTPATDEYGFIRDKDGFIMRVFDRFNPSLVKPMERLCPYCHNPLPLPDYGKYPTLFISVVGITSSGKTVYLKQLLGNLSSAIKNTGYRIGAVNLDQDNGVVASGQPLPGSTDNQTMRRPMAVSLLRESNPSHGLTLVFYDIAGENCVASVNSDGTIDNHALIGHFIARSDALLFLIDPKQVPLFAPVGKNSVAEVQDVIKVVTKIRASLNPKHPSWDGIPVAVVLTKSDSLAGKLEDSSPVFHDINRKVPGDPNHMVQGFVLNEFKQINSALQEKFEKNASALMADVAAFGLRGFFAVSALVGGVSVSVEKYKNLYMLDADNENKFMQLRDWADGWNQRSPEERRHYPNCPIRTSQGEKIEFAPEQSITEELGNKIETEIFGVTNELGTVAQEYFTLSDVAMTLNPLSFPIGIPKARRVEEPILWILWQKRCIMPRFQGKAMPTKHFFESAKYYNERCAATARENAIEERRFYNCEI